MIAKSINNQQIIIRELGSADFDNLFVYLQKLSEETKRRFGPHSFDKESIFDFYCDQTNSAYLAQDSETSEIIAYSVIKKGFIEHDHQRFLSYGLVLDETNDCTFAPSVADLWQGCGVGSIMFQHIVSDLKLSGTRRVFLWGGVQAGNERAINYYKKYGFSIVGHFFHNVDNYDMVLDLF